MPMDPMIQTATLSLAWFITGVVAGRHLMPQKRKKSNRSKRAPGGGGGRSGVSELYVGNLPYGCSERELRKMFSRHGQVVSVRLIKNRSNGKSKGFGFVEMPDSDVPGAVKALSGKPMKGRKLVVNEAKSRARRR
jgi:RNA recognition motif-containing protein